MGNLNSWPGNGASDDTLAVIYLTGLSIGLVVGIALHVWEKVRRCHS